MKILGIDPGSQKLGWGYVQILDGRITGLENGVISASKGPFNSRLQEMSLQLEQLCREFSPDVAVIERIFLGKNADSAFKLGHIRGLCIVECQKAGAEIIEYTPRQVKKIITGKGAADKQALRSMLYARLGIHDNGRQSLDASDALALAYCYCLRWETQCRLHQGEHHRPSI